MGKLIQRRRVKGWRKPEGAINCANPSPWSNPFTRESVRHAYEMEEEWKFFWRRHCTENFARWLRDPNWRGGIFPERRKWILTHLHELAGPDVILMCWDGDWEPGEPEIACHCVVLLNMANELEAVDA